MAVFQADPELFVQPDRVDDVSFEVDPGLGGMRSRPDADMGGVVGVAGRRRGSHADEESHASWARAARPMTKTPRRMPEVS